jgi:ribosomal protein L29
MANETTYTISAEEKAMLDELKAKQAAAEEKKAKGAVERSEKRAARQDIANFGFVLKDEDGISEYNKLGAFTVTSSKFGRMIAIHRGHDNNAVYFARELKGGKKYEIGANTRGKKCTKNIILVKNNKDTVLTWITAAFQKFSTFEEAVQFLKGALTVSGKAKFASFDLDELNAAAQDGDKRAASKAKEIGNLYTSKGIGGTTIIELGKKG